MAISNIGCRTTAYRNFIALVSNQLAARIQQALAERAERAELAGRLIDAQEDERRLLASELHDEYGQNLTAIAALALSIESTSDPSTSKEEAATIQTIVQDMMRSLRGTLLRLKPAEIDKFGLSEALRPAHRVLERVQPPQDPVRSCDYGSDR